MILLQVVRHVIVGDKIEGTLVGDALASFHLVLLLLSNRTGRTRTGRRISAITNFTILSMSIRFLVMSSPLFAISVVLRIVNFDAIDERSEVGSFIVRDNGGPVFGHVVTGLLGAREFAFVVLEYHVAVQEIGTRKRVVAIVALPPAHFAMVGPEMSR